MKKSCLMIPFLAALVGAGCFKHREAPDRPVTANTLAEAVEKRATVECVNLAGQAVAALPLPVF